MSLIVNFLYYIEQSHLILPTKKLLYLFMSKDLSALLSSKIKSLFDEEEQKDFDGVDDYNRLSLVFSDYELKIMFFQEQLNLCQRQNENLKQVVAQMEQKQNQKSQSQIYSNNSSFIRAVAGNSNISNAEDPFKDISDLTELIEKIQSQRQGYKNEKNQLEKKLSDKQEIINKLYKDNIANRQELDSLYKNQSSLKEEIQETSKQFSSMRQTQEEQRRKYQQKFLIQFQLAVNTNTSKEQEVRAEQKLQLQSQLSDTKNKLSMVISKVNEVLQIKEISQNQDIWMKEMVKQAQNYRKEIEYVVPDRIKNQNNFVMNLAQLQKEKNAASRFRLKRINEGMR